MKMIRGVPFGTWKKQTEANIALRKERKDRGESRVETGNIVSLPEIPNVVFFVFQEWYGDWNFTEFLTGHQAGTGEDLNEAKADVLKKCERARSELGTNVNERITKILRELGPVNLAREIPIVVRRRA